jgi:hypothetical protein
MGSVPAKFETIVYLNAETKKKGFGSNSERFQETFTTTKEDPLPGPGSYLSDATTNLMLK